ncbi:EF-hand domain-containing family member B [Hondaea fermentalgiana]|uniref:EF-hand domain-containing family member B n=1 Tax=Hondaea fermentalgiana TaxID=2315210 RepID=A0A2R5GZ70_9STRA|nr:EF-hand domain-containing family member B [Hondaea fermentalgiana]|eukprot:GBG33324.1 EF-hand domain-containing family member B [Hondaea fermentalgiana]
MLAVEIALSVARFYNRPDPGRQKSQRICGIVHYQTIVRRGEGAAACLRHDGRPQTPEKLRKFRNSNVEAGKRVTHWGAADDIEELRARLADTRLGARSSCSEGTFADALPKRDPGSLAEYIQDRKESIYKTNRTEPLGKPYVRGHDYSSLGEPKLLAKGANDESAKDLIYAPQVEGKDLAPEDAAELRRRYKLSHNSFEPGEQRQRNYNWKSINPKNHRFGSVDMGPKDEGVAYCLKESAQTEITNVAVANHRAITSDALGKPKYRGNVDSASIRKLEERQTMRRLNPEEVVTAQDCIQGSYTLEQQLPDEGLGRATRPGWRNDTSSDRRFGAPTVRTDIPAPTVRSVSDAQNYGDDTDAAKLLYPSRFVAEGVDDSDYVDPIDREDIRDVMARIGYEYTDDEFERIFRRAASLAGVSDLDVASSVNQPIVSIQGFLSVANERFRALDLGTEPAWWDDA